MSCSPKFPKVFPLECLRELATDGFTGELKLEEWKEHVRKVAWCIGCVAAYLDNEMPDDVSVASTLGDDELVELVQAELHMNDVTAVRSRSLITEAAIKLIIEFLLRLMANAITTKPLAVEEPDDE